MTGGDVRDLEAANARFYAAASSWAGRRCAGGPDHLGAGKAIATNVFVVEGGRWRMLAHHASPVLHSS